MEVMHAGDAWSGPVVEVRSGRRPIRSGDQARPKPLSPRPNPVDPAGRRVGRRSWIKMGLTIHSRIGVLISDSGPASFSQERSTLPAHTFVERSLELVKVDFAPTHRQPSPARLLLATVVALVGSLAADAALVALGEAVFPSTKGYAHFQFGDYAKLTVIGIVIACAAWPIVTRISSAPRWLFFRLAIVVTVVLLLPDLYILHQGQPGRAVAVLMCMHLAIALVTYNALVRLAPIRAGRPGGSSASDQH
jgi:hypothetical protein